MTRLGETLRARKKERKFEKRENPNSEDPPLIRARKLKHKMGRSHFIRMFLKNWFCKRNYLLEIYQTYLQDDSFCRALNNYLIYGKTFNEHWDISMGELVKEGLNTSLEIFGEQGMGKTTVGREIGTQIARAFNMAVRWYLDIRDTNTNKFEINPGNLAKFDDILVTYDFSQSELVIKAPVDYPGRVVFQDECPKMTGQGSQKIQIQLQNVLDISARAHQINFIFINPDPENIHLKLNWYLQLLARDKGRRESLLAVAIKIKQRLFYQGILVLKITEDPSFGPICDRISRGIKTEILETGGSSTLQWATMDQDMALLMEEIKSAKMVLHKRKNIEAFIFGNKKLRKLKSSIFLPQILTLAEEEMARLRKNNKETIQIEYAGAIDKDFEVDIAQMLRDEYPVENDIDARNVELAIEYEEMKAKGADHPQDVLAIKYQIEQSTISKAVGSTSKIGGWISERIGYKYESYLFQKLQAEYGDKIISIENPGKEGKDKADIVVCWDDNGKKKYYVYSVKCYLPQPGRKMVSFPIAELQTEIEECNNIKDADNEAVVRLIFHFYDRLTKRWTEQDVRFARPPKNVNVPLDRGEAEA